MKTIAFQLALLGFGLINQIHSRPVLLHGANSDLSAQVRFYEDCDWSFSSFSSHQQSGAEPEFHIDDLEKYQQYWGTVVLANLTDNELWSVDLGSFLMEEMDIWVETAAGIKTYKAGQYIAGSNKQVKQTNEPIAYFALRSGDTARVSFRFTYYEDIPGIRNVGFTILPLTDYLDKMTDHHSYLTFIIGAYFILVFCALILFVYTREWLYLYYLLYIAIGAIFVTSYDGLLTEYFLDSNPSNFKFFWLLGCLAPTIYLLFMKEFLTLNKGMPIFDKIVKGVVVISVVLLAACFVLMVNGDHFDEAGKILHYLILGQMAFMLISQFVLIPKVGKDYRVVFFVIGSFFYLGTSIVAEFQGFGTSVGIATGALIEGLIFATGMGYRIRVNAKERQRNLEVQVKERTKEVESQKVELEKRNRHNEILLKEVHHRVKNNLQIIYSILNIQERSVQDKHVRFLLDKSKSRIKSLGLIHEFLFKNEYQGDLELDKYCDKLIELLLEIFDASERKVIIRKNIVSEKVSIDLLISLGLIITELISNSIKHADTEGGPLEVNCNVDLTDTEVVVQVSDNGRKGPENETDVGFGKAMVEAICQNHGGEAKFENNDGFYARAALPHSDDSTATT